jgi:hypothetical protein
VGGGGALRRQIDPFMPPMMVIRCGTLRRENRKAQTETWIESVQGENLISKKVNLSLCLLVKHYAMKTYGGVEV